MTHQEIKDTIKDLKDGLNSSFTPEQFKPRMEAKIKELEAQLTTASTPEPKKSAPAKAPATPPSKKSVTITDGKQKIEIDILNKFPNNVYQVSKKVATALLKSNKFNDDKWGQFYVSEDNDVNDEDPNWVYIEDTKDSDEFSVLEEGAIFLTLGNDVKSVVSSGSKPKTETPKKETPEPKKETPEPKKETPERKKSVPLPKKSEDDEYDCDDLIAQAKERRKKAKERAKLPQKSEATKNKEKLEKVFENVKERADEQDITKAELVKLIAETKSLLTLLEKKLSSL